jgi:hypothetical protein
MSTKGSFMSFSIFVFFLSFIDFLFNLGFPLGCGAETPTSEPGLCAIDAWDSDWEEDPEDFYLYRHQVGLCLVYVPVRVFTHTLCIC